MNQVQITGTISKDPIVRDGQYGKYAYLSIKVDDEGKTKGPYVFVEVGSYIVNSLAGLTNGSHVFVTGFLKGKKNNRTGAWELLVKAQNISAGAAPQYQQVSQVQVTQPAPFQAPQQTIPLAQVPTQPTPMQPGVQYKPAPQPTERGDDDFNNQVMDLFGN